MSPHVGKTTLALGAVWTGVYAQRGGPSAQGSDNAPSVDPEEYNFIILRNINILWAILVVLFAAYFIILRLLGRIRQTACCNDDVQGLFKIPNTAWSGFKRNIADAPLFKTRYHREFRPAPKLNAGTPPARFQAIFLLAYYGVNVLFVFLFIDLNSPDALGLVHNRTGVLALINLIPLMLLATRNNPLIKLYGVSFDSFNLLHRWFGRLVVILATAHTITYVVEAAEGQSFADVWVSTFQDDFLRPGMIAMLAFAAILLQSNAVARHAFYEIFLQLHTALAAVVVVGLWIHLDGYAYQGILIGVIAIWGKERIFRIVRLLYRNVGRGGSHATVDILPGDAMRVTLRIARPWTFQPGQHIYLHIPSVGFGQSHPFSLVWSGVEHEWSPEGEKGVAITTEAAEDATSAASSITSVEPASETPTPTMNLVIKRRAGFTNALWKKAAATPDGRLSVRCAVEGPYGGQSLRSYGTVLLFAAGVGITHHVPHLRDLIAGRAEGYAATRRLVLVWVMQSPEHLDWVRPWMTAILELPERRSMLRILLFVTRPRAPQELEIESPSASIQLAHGRPDVRAIVDAELEARVGTMAVAVCGTGSLADDVRRAARGTMGRANVDFVENAFSW